ncbi:MAG: hemerythrin domain-containing protein [Actinomycetota bacterium]|nr:hemerythrin domain-containing protein [Actinomycetota bacterium]
MTETGSFSIVSILGSDHESIAELLDEPSARQDGERGDVARDQLVAELIRHFVAEEQYLFPALREHVAGGAEMADAEFARDRVLEQQAVVVSLGQACDAATLAELGEGALGAEQLAPTRPRLIAPSSAPVNKVTSLVVGFVDQVRDHYSRRGIDPDAASREET